MLAESEKNSSTLSSSSSVSCNTFSSKQKNNEYAVYTNPIGCRVILFLNEPIIWAATYMIFTGIFLLSFSFYTNKNLVSWLFFLFQTCKLKFIFISVFCPLGWIYFLRKIAAGKMIPKNLINTTSLQNKTVVVTGGHSGIGKETVMQLLQWKVSCVVIGARNIEKANAFVEFLKKNQLIAHENQVFAWKLNLEEKGSIQAFCQNIYENKINIDILINNAGIMQPRLPKYTNEEGVEIHFVTNHLGHFLLTNLLLENLKKNNAKIINVSSLAHALCDFHSGYEFSELTNVNNNSYNASRYYAISKLANIWFTRELQRRLSGDKSTNATTYSVHPGCIKTDLSRDIEKNFFYKILIYFLAFTVFKNSKDGAATQLYLCASDLRDLQPGCYYAECKPMYVSPAAISIQKEKELWKFSEKLLRINF